MRRLALVAVFGAIPSCSEAVPAGYQAAEAGITRAEQFREQAEACYRAASAGSGLGAPCAEAAGLYQELSLTPIHFDDDAEWERFREGFAGGTNLLLKSVFSSLCDGSIREGLSPGEQALCRTRRRVLESQMSRLLGS
jgi:hypothetical protein